MRSRVIAVFHVRHVDVDNAIEQSERFEAVVSASVVYKRKPQPTLRRNFYGREICATTWLGVTRLTLWQPRACSLSIIRASSSSLASWPSPCQEISQFWQ